MSNKPITKYTKSSGNVFADLGMHNAEEKLAKAELAFRINQLLKERELDQTQAAKLLNIDQAKISALNRGRLAGFSMERLMKYLSLLDQDIEIIIKPHQLKSANHLRVVY